MRNMSDAHKTEQFLELYDEHFKKWQDKKVRMLEIGVQKGGSLRIWQEFFHDLELVGVDTDPKCLEYATPNVKIFIGDQGNRDFLDRLGEFDIIVDDGGHTMNQQQISFDVLFRKLSLGGVYVIEDLHTSYWKQFRDLDLSTVEFLQSLTHDINAEATKSGRNDDLPKIENVYNIASIHFYESIAFIYKKNVR